MSDDAKWLSKAEIVAYRLNSEGLMSDQLIPDAAKVIAAALAEAYAQGRKDGHAEADREHKRSQHDIDAAMYNVSANFGWTGCDPNSHGVYVNIRDGQVLCKFCKRDVRR